MTYIGDFALGATFDIKFTTVNASGAPTALAGTPVVSAYPGNSTTELTAGITLTVDFDARTGMHNVRVVATGANGYATATNYALVITTGMVGGTSVVGYVVGHFSIENRSALRPTTAGSTLTIESNGMAYADVKEWLGVAPSVLITGRVDANAQVVGDKTGYALTQAFPTNFAALSITAGGLVDMTQAAADKVWASASRTLTAFSTALAVSVWDVLESAIGVASSIGVKVKTNLDATVSSRLASASYISPPSAAANAAAVWDEARAGHVAAGTFGQGVASVQGNVTGSVVSVTGAVGSVAGNVGGNVTGSVGSVVGHTPQTGDSFARLGAPAGGSIVADIAAVPTAAANADALLDRANGVETGLTLRQCLRLVSATLFGKLSGAATTTVTIRDFGDTKNRISATVDAEGNRSAVVTDAS